jgi:spore germination cell wall hydrolase CwlJ-like protein
MYIVEDTLAMLGAVVVLTVVSMFAYNESDDTPIDAVEVTQTVEIIPSWYDFAHEETECLATNIYFEARGESYEGQKAVAFVTLNRVDSNKFPNDICSVVYQAKHSDWWAEHKDRLVPIRNKCQFSWYCDGKSDSIRNTREYESLYRLASEVIVGKHKDNTDGALWYHANYVRPDWRLTYAKTVDIDDHIFYK